MLWTGTLPDTFLKERSGSGVLRTPPPPTAPPPGSMEAREQTLDLLNTLWSKLQGLPNADPLDLGAFFIILAFILLVVLMVVLASLSCCCCCCCKPTKGARI